MRSHVEPTHTTRCDRCKGELRLKEVIESVNPTLDLDEQIFVCANCGSEQKCIARHSRYQPHLKTP